jgi:hypothetical protein
VTRDVSLSILYGLFVGTVFFILREHRRVSSKFERHVDELEDKALNLPIALSHMEDVDPFFKQIARHTRDEALRLGREAGEGKIVLHPRSLMSIIMDYFKQIKPNDRVFATNIGVGFDTPQGDAYRKQNIDLAKSGVDFTRVFIEGMNFTPELKKRQREEMDRQKEHIKVRFVKESSLPPETRRNFVLVFDRYVAYAEWVKTTSIKREQLAEGVSFYTNPSEIENAKQLAETITSLSEEYI